MFIINFLSQKLVHKLKFAINDLAIKLRTVRIFILILTLLIFFLLHSFNVFSTILLNVTEHLNKFAVNYGFILENIYIEGQKHTHSDQIYAAIDNKMTQPVTTLNLKKIKKHLELVSWIKHAIVELELPNSLYIAIIERQPIAIWQHQNILYLIDNEGNAILEKNLKPFIDLIIVVGEDAPLQVMPLLNILKEDQQLFSLINAAIRVGERRWNIRFKDGLEVKLSEEDPAKDWNYIIKLYRNKNLFAPEIKVIDLRVSDRLYIN